MLSQQTYWDNLALGVVCFQNRLENKLDLDIERTPEKLYKHLKNTTCSAAKEALGVEECKTWYKDTIGDELQELIKDKKTAYLRRLYNKENESRKKVCKSKQ